MLFVAGHSKAGCGGGMECRLAEVAHASLIIISERNARVNTPLGDMNLPPACLTPLSSRRASTLCERVKICPNPQEWRLQPVSVSFNA